MKNPPTTSELSLYQLAHTLESQPSVVTVRTSTFKALVETLISLLIEQQIRATVWVKLPLTQAWLESIDKYHRQELADRIYLCSISKGNAHTTTVPASATNMTSIVLEASSQLKREHFVLVVSPHLCSLILAQELPSVSTTELSVLNIETSQVKLLYTFNPTVVESILAEIKQAIAITDTTPEELLADSVPAFPLPRVLDANFLTYLLRKQLQEAETVEPPLSQVKREAGKSLLAQSNFNEDFLKELTRELSIPLTNLKTALSLLESMQHKREPRQRYLMLLQRECDRQSSLIAGLQEWTQLSKPIEGSSAAVKLEDCVPGIVSTYQPIAEEKGILLGYTIPAGFPAVACPDSWLKQILRNLLHNSLKFTPASGRVYVQASLQNNGVELTVSDTGIGIENSDIPKIFASFYRGRNATTDETAGVGLGLAIVRDLIQRCGGQISVTSQVGKGTLFKMLFPIVG